MGPAVREVLQELWWFALARETTPKEGAREFDAVALPALAGAATSPAVAGRIAYLRVPQTACRAHPQGGFDSRLGILTFGVGVMVDRLEDDWAYVRTAACSGWVAAATLTAERADVSPEFVAGEHYLATNPETQKLRLHVQDGLDGGTLRLPLQSTEYVLYRWQQAQICLTWPNVRPRVPGAWQTILRGHPAVQLGVEPRTNAVLECAGSGQRPFLGYVESVTPEQTITVASVGQHRDGEFQRHTYTPREWRELRPVFCSVV